MIQSLPSDPTMHKDSENSSTDFGREFLGEAKSSLMLFIHISVSDKWMSLVTDNNKWIVNGLSDPSRKLCNMFLMHDYVIVRLHRSIL